MGPLANLTTNGPNSRGIFVLGLKLGSSYNGFRATFFCRNKFGAMNPMIQMKLKFNICFPKNENYETTLQEGKELPKKKTKKEKREFTQRK